MPERVEHCLSPVADPHSRILILGTMPSPASRVYGFYYSHPRNRFWPVLANLLNEPIPSSPDKKRDMCLRNRIALWDVLSACDIKGASDSSISSPEINDISSLAAGTDIRAVFTTGTKASQLYRRYLAETVGLPHFALPSTSPANAKMTTEQLTEHYSVMLPWLH